MSAAEKLKALQQRIENYEEFSTAELALSQIVAVVEAAEDASDAWHGPPGRLRVSMGQLPVVLAALDEALS